MLNKEQLKQLQEMQQESDEAPVELEKQAKRNALKVLTGRYEPKDDSPNKYELLNPDKVDESLRKQGFTVSPQKKGMFDGIYNLINKMRK